ncbi:sigma factor-like helix-turn-helix DNA-binding protein [Agarivorans sp. Z349TD_8]|uniref:sigma factor-like helix-turn-helix DNA-binding protein n=1 Tax=Agarivorans sp. Z349TD_8 TaxID=3421434 RepID=UPI003F6C536A
MKTDLLITCNPKQLHRIIYRVEQEVADEQLSLAILDKLSEKERQVLELILERNSQKEVAQALGVGVRTVFNRVRSIENKANKFRSNS